MARPNTSEKPSMVGTLFWFFLFLAIGYILGITLAISFFAFLGSLMGAVSQILGTVLGLALLFAILFMVWSSSTWRTAMSGLICGIILSMVLGSDLFASTSTALPLGSLGCWIMWFVIILLIILLVIYIIIKRYTIVRRKDLVYGLREKESKQKGSENMAGKKPGPRSKHSRRMDNAKRSKEPHERGRGAPKKGNPRYRPGRTTKGSPKKKTYCVRDPNKKDRKRKK